jgi:hypothetical protein
MFFPNLHWFVQNDERTTEAPADPKDECRRLIPGWSPDAHGSFWIGPKPHREVLASGRIRVIGEDCDRAPVNVEAFQHCSFKGRLLSWPGKQNC